MNGIRVVLMVMGITVASICSASEKAGHLSAPPVEHEATPKTAPGVVKPKNRERLDVPPAVETSTGSEVKTSEANTQETKSSEEESSKAHGPSTLPNAKGDGASEEEQASHNKASENNHVVTLPKDEGHAAKGGALKGWFWFGGVFAVLAFLIFIFT